MPSLGEFRFVGFLVLRADQELLVFVPDQFSPDQQDFDDKHGVYVKALLTGKTCKGGKGLDDLEQGRIIYGEGTLAIAGGFLPEVHLRVLLGLGKDENEITPPAHIMERYLKDIGVSSHLRRLPQGMKASKTQRLLAAKDGIILPEGYTYVTGHVRKSISSKDPQPKHKT